MSDILFQPCKIGNLELRNRFVRSATWDCSADDTGAVTDTSVEIYRRLGEGEIGLIIVAFSYVTPLGQANPGQYGIHTDDMIPGLKRLADAVHRGGAKISMQLVHAGIQSRYHNPLGTVLPAVSKLDTLEVPHFEMTEGDIETLVSEYAAAASRVKEAGFDAVQLHAAHGYGISQFLSPVYNKRTDRWGGSAENRRRFLLEVIRKIRETTGPDFPLLVKLGVQDDEEGGLSIEEGTGTAREAEKEGIDAIEVSAGVGGTPVRIIRRSAPEDAYFRGRAAAVRKAVSVPVIVVGGIRSLEMAEDIVRSGDADLISMCRTFIREPGIIARWRRGETEPATCIHCNKCFSLLSRGGTLECGEDIHQRRRAERGF